MLNFCPNCGKEIVDEQFYCKYCGISLREIDDQPINTQKREVDSKEEDITIIQERDEIQNDLEKANEFKNKGDYEKALSYYSMYLSFNPTNSEAWGNKGFVLSLLGKYEEAITCFERALDLNPQMPQLILLNKGNSLINLNKNKEAILCCNSALEIDSNISHTWYSKAVAYMNLEMHDRALTCFKKALEIDPNHEEALNNKKKLLEIIKGDIHSS